MYNVEFKSRLLKYCIDYFAERVKLADDSIKLAQQSANEEQKSSAGDKYETARAMSQNARDMHAQSMDNAMQTWQFLQSLNPKTNTKAVLGSLVVTNKATYFVAASIGIIPFEGNTIAIISMATPIGKLLENKSKGDSFDFQNQKITIIEIY